ncbi:MAG: peptidylprolyl isomerase [Bacteroidota bacterium]|nr:peptidylprolyl isomerase [Bacteroidota bacterium]
MVIYLYKATPKHRMNFIRLASEGYFDGTTFHRCIKNFVIQGGDPNTRDNDTLNDGDGGPDYLIKNEISKKLIHKYGSVGAARDDHPKMASHGSQFYIVTNPAGTPHLDGKYTVFGEVISGIEVAEIIADQPRNDKDRPLTDIPMTVSIHQYRISQANEEYGFDISKLQAK